MAPPATGAARRAAAAPQPRPSARRPAAPRLRARAPPVRPAGAVAARATCGWPSRLVVGSLLAVVVGDAMVAQGQVRLADSSRPIAAQQATQKSMQTEVAQLAAPDRVVAQGIALGLTAPAQVVDLPQVPLDVPLPVPDTTPLPAAPHRRRRRPPPGRSRGDHRRAATAGGHPRPPPTPAATAATADRRPRRPPGEPRRPPQPAHPGDAPAARGRLRVMVLRLVQVQEFGTPALRGAVPGPAHPDRHRARRSGAASTTATARSWPRRSPGRPWSPTPRSSPSPAAGGRGPGAAARDARPTRCGPSSPSPPASSTWPTGCPTPWPPPITKLDLNGINLVPESQRVVPGRPAGPARGRHGRLERRRHLGHGVPVPVARWPARPGRPTSSQSPDGVALPSGDQLDAGRPGHRPGAHPRRVGPVRGRAGAGRRDPGLPRHRRHRGDHGREDRRHPGHGQPDGRPVGDSATTGRPRRPRRPARRP